MRYALRQTQVVRYAQRDMTVCIALKAQHSGTPHIVICADQMISPVYTSAETGWKVVPLSRGFTALIAGDVSDARELSGIYRQLTFVREVTDENALELLRDGLQQFKSKLASQYCVWQLHLAHLWQFNLAHPWC
jgi:20S proteasome alpha/beta subunit